MSLHIDHKVHAWTLASIGAALATLILFAVPALAQPVHIVALGDSNTYGKGVLPSESYPARLEALLKEKGADVVVTNAGISGNTSRDMLARLEKAVPPGTQIVILQPGGNDWRRGLYHERQANITKIRRWLEARGIDVVVVENTVTRSVPWSERAADLMHFTPKGYATLAERILPLAQTAVHLVRTKEVRAQAVAAKTR